MRFEIINQIGDLEDKHCKGCMSIKEIKDSRRKNICLQDCKVGQRIQKLGDQLSGKEEIKSKPKKAGKATKKKSNAAIARELKEQGLSIQAISKKLKLKESTVSGYVSGVEKRKKQSVKSRGEVKPVENIEKVAVQSTKEVVELKKRVKELELEITRWEDLSKRHKADYSKQLEAKAELAIKLREFEEYARKKETELDAVQAEHIEVLNENAKLKEELAQAKREPMATAYDQQEQVDRLSIKLKTEQEKHRYLLSYLVLDNSQ